MTSVFAIESGFTELCNAAQLCNCMLYLVTSDFFVVEPGFGIIM